MPLSNLTKEIYRYALAHLETEKARLDTLIARITGKASPAPTDSLAPAKKTKQKHVFSPEGKARMVEAQKSRWAAFHAKQKETTDMLAKLERKAKGKKVMKKAAKKAAKKTATKKTASDVPF